MRHSHCSLDVAEKLLDFFGEAQIKRRPMGAEAKKYFAYARECARQAGEATTAERRDKLLELARVWTIAALTVGNIVVPPARTETPQPEWQNGNGRQFARNTATSLTAMGIVLGAWS